MNRIAPRPRLGLALAGAAVLALIAGPAAAAPADEHEPDVSVTVPTATPTATPTPTPTPTPTDPPARTSIPADAVVAVSATTPDSVLPENPVVYVGDTLAICWAIPETTDFGDDWTLARSEAPFSLASAAAVEAEILPTEPIDIVGVEVGQVLCAGYNVTNTAPGAYAATLVLGWDGDARTPIDPAFRFRVENKPPQNPGNNNPGNNNNGGGNNNPGGGNGGGSGGSSGGAGGGSGGAVARAQATATEAAAEELTAPATEPAISGTPATTAEEAKADAVTYPAGGRVTVTAEGFTPGEQVQVVVYSEPVLIGNVPARDDGTFEHAFGLPSEIAPGTHTVQLTGWQSQRVAQVKVVVTGEPLTAGQAPALPDIPAWLWWVLGGIAAVLVLVGGWWIVRVMRAPEAEAVPA